MRNIPCVASVDPYMIDLSKKEGRAGDLCRARLDIKSTIDETRAARLADASTRGPLPVHLSYCGAATKRWAGDGKLNYQNLPRDGGLRGAIEAPPGCKLVIVDFAQIEYRILVGLADDLEHLAALREGRDFYCEFGSQLYGRKITKADKPERQFAKTVVLGCGYGMGKEKFAAVCRAKGFVFDKAFTDRAIDVYRDTHAPVVKFWRSCENALGPLSKTEDYEFKVGNGLVIPFRSGSVILPTGLPASFELTFDPNGGKFGTGGWTRTVKSKSRTGTTQENYYGAAFTEFLCQSLARVVLSDVVVRARKELGVRPALLVHDEVVTVAPEGGAEGLKVRLEAMMSETSHWWPGGPPVGAEGRMANDYGKG